VAHFLIDLRKWLYHSSGALELECNDSGAVHGPKYIENVLIQAKLASS
jgi:hypothetical protein